MACLASMPVWHAHAQPPPDYERQVKEALPKLRDESAGTRQEAAEQIGRALPEVKDEAMQAEGVGALSTALKDESQAVRMLPRQFYFRSENPLFHLYCFSLNMQILYQKINYRYLPDNSVCGHLFIWKYYYFCFLNSNREKDPRVSKATGRESFVYYPL